MTTTRSAAKKQQQPSGAPPAEEAQPGSKHKTEEAPASRSPKRTKKADRTAASEKKGKQVKEKKEREHVKEEKERQEKEKQEKEGQPVKEQKKEKEGEPEKEQQQQNGTPKETKEAPKPSEPKEPTTSAVEPRGRDDTDSLPSSILEKGIIYFFFRPRVNIDSPSAVSDIARSHIILRPIAKDAKLGGGPIGDAGNTRLCLLPKKTLPQSGRDRWTAFVEKSGASFQTLKEEFLRASEEYQTKTAGARHTPAATPVGEGVYAITSTGRASHLVYMLTLPGELGEVQREIGLKERGSFVISTKNPEFPGPANARLPKAPEYPKEFFEEFRSLRWVPAQPKHLDYVNTQFLLVGESSGVEKALEPQKKDQEEGKAEPVEEMEKLEDEDVQRMKELSKDDSGRIFADLQVNAGDYPKLKTTF